MRGRSERRGGDEWETEVEEREEKEGLPGRREEVAAGEGAGEEEN